MHVEWEQKFESIFQTWPLFLFKGHLLDCIRSGTQGVGQGSQGAASPHTFHSLAKLAGWLGELWASDAVVALD